ncbi:unnamed protein product [Triticum turgidum subsp. durum]|uniref:Uncharacterized protein n=1 Tax=Triticum turgidum subsp. durum TaxID=4567 RepID=A0A9R1P783_TRITD|nr:unnamed protein product [Triticum turgidum subsp. durum]
MDQHQELEVDVEGEPTDQRKEEEADADAGKPEEPTDQRKEEEEREEGDNLKEPTDQRKEDKPDGLTEQHKAEAVAVAVVVAEVDKSEELTDQRKAGAVVEVEVDKFEELTDQRKEEAAEDKDKETERSSSEESPSLFVHPCSLLLRYLVRAYAWCMGMADWFGGGGTRPSAAPAASLNSSREEAGEAAGVRTREMREMIVSMWAVRRPRPPGNPREGRGGGGGSHN